MSEENHVSEIDVDLLRSSPTQPRKHFNERKLEELTNSMRQHGFAFGALLVRPLADGTFEIVIGERRARAAKLAGISKVPCSIRKLGDGRVVALQLIENLQRSDLNPIEEADGWKKLLEQEDERTGKRLYPTIESAAICVGKDAEVVRKRLLLCNLEGEAREAVESGLLPAKTGYLIARIPSASLRAVAAQEILHPVMGANEHGVLGLRDAETIMERFTRDLRKAPFAQEDADLLPLRLNELQTRVAGGACTDCPYKSGNIPGIEGQKKNNCLNPSCYDEKIEAEWTQWQARETDLARKRRALGRAESLAVFSKDFPGQPAFASGYVDLDQFPTSDELKAGEQSPAPWRVLIAGVDAGPDFEIIVARDSKSKTHELVARQAAVAAAKANGHDFFKVSDRGKNQAKQTRKEIGLEPPPDMPEHERDGWLNHQASRDEIDAQRKASEMARSQSEDRARLVADNCFDQLRKKAKPSTEFLRKLALFIFGQRPANERLLKRYKLPVAEDISRNVTRWSVGDVIAFTTEFIVTDGGYNFALDDDDRTWLKLFGIDARAEEKRLARLDAKDKAADEKRIAKATGKK